MRTSPRRRCGSITAEAWGAPPTTRAEISPSSRAAPSGVAPGPSRARPTMIFAPTTSMRPGLVGSRATHRSASSGKPPPFRTTPRTGHLPSTDAQRAVQDRRIGSEGSPPQALGHQHRRGRVQPVRIGAQGASHEHGPVQEVEEALGDRHALDPRGPALTHQRKLALQVGRDVVDRAGLSPPGGQHRVGYAREPVLLGDLVHGHDPVGLREGKGGEEHAADHREDQRVERHRGRQDRHRRHDAGGPPHDHPEGKAQLVGQGARHPEDTPTPRAPPVLRLAIAPRRGEVPEFLFRASPSLCRGHALGAQLVGALPQVEAQLLVHLARRISRGRPGAIPVSVSRRPIPSPSSYFSASSRLVIAAA